MAPIFYGVVSPRLRVFVSIMARSQIPQELKDAYDLVALGFPLKGTRLAQERWKRDTIWLLESRARSMAGLPTRDDL